LINGLCPLHMMGQRHFIGFDGGVNHLQFL
jgi:hypothetical protein